MRTARTGKDREVEAGAVMQVMSEWTAEWAAAAPCTFMAEAERVLSASLSTHRSVYVGKESVHSACSEESDLEKPLQSQS